MSNDQRPQINVKDVSDLVIRRNFQNMKDYFTSQGQLLDFQFFEAVFGAAESNRKISHTLGVVPKDIIVTLITGAGAASFQLGKFTKDEIYISTNGACRVRFFIGCADNDSQAPTSASDVMTVYAQSLASVTNITNTTTITTSTPTFTKLTAASGTYTPPANCKYIRVRACGSGGGGAGGSGASNSPVGSGGSNGQTTTFGPYISLAGGDGGGGGSSSGANGGVASYTGSATYAIGRFVNGGCGGAGFQVAGAAAYNAGGIGGTGIFGGAGAGGGAFSAGKPGVAETGAGGGGGGTNGTVASNSGAGGGGGAWCDCAIPIVAGTTSFAYVVGASVGGGTGVNVGGASGSGVIEIWEYY